MVKKNLFIGVEEKDDHIPNTGFRMPVHSGQKHGQGMGDVR